ncbi:hypothetical protein HPB51_029820 [Rhipicephalus microplus]|uniref:DUF4708 domain-containing protein n=1 Tax=Rhipicephalus microplus TaxID=6941 RepID=A0A9J6CSQ7_RHIMP|nr:hypothetical protein HPB51_029820 [Rhipicephalus microplus]
MSDAAVFFFTNVNYDNLECVSLIYDNYELSIEASRQRHIYKTRELIFRESHVTAAPVLQAPYSVMATIPLVDLLGTSKISHETWVQLRENEVAIEPMECFVLPSMKIALATAVSFKLFSDCPFRSFKDLKKFWKNTYGYRLPCKTEPRMTFVKVRFQTRNDRYYVYPILCVRPTEVQPLAPINPDPIIGSFLQCVKLRMGQLLGEPFSMVSRSPAFPTPQLHWTAKDTRAHFEENNYEQHRADGWKKLKPNAVPTLFTFKPLPKERKPPKERTVPAPSSNETN